MSCSVAHPDQQLCLQLIVKQEACAHQWLNGHHGRHELVVLAHQPLLVVEVRFVIHVREAQGQAGEQAS